MTAHRRVVTWATVFATAIVASLVATSLASSAPSRTTIDRQDMVIFDLDSGKPADPSNFNPYGQNTVMDGGISQALLEPLFITNVVTGKEDPWLGLRVTSLRGGKVWRLTLRKGVKWSDGKPFTADDVVFTVQLLQKHSDLNSSIKFPGVKVRALNPTTVLFTLPKADPRFALSNLSGLLPRETLWVLPKHIWASVKDPATFKNYDPKKGWPVGTGAYKLDSFTPTSFTYVRNANWWGKTAGFRPLPAPKALRWIALGSEATRAAAIASNDLDTGQNFSVGAYQALAARNRSVSAWSPGAPYGFYDPCARSLDFNTADPVWKNPRLRWAASYAINRKTIINVAFQGATQGSLTMLPAFPGLDHYTALLRRAGVFKQFPISTTNAAIAKKTIESQGYVSKGGVYQKGGDSLSLEITTFDDPAMLAIASTIGEELQQVGIKTDVRKMTIPNFIDALLAGKFQANVFFGACGSTVDPWKSMDAFNVSHYAPVGKNVSGFYSNSFRWNTPQAEAYSKIVDRIATVGPGSKAINPLFVNAMKIWYAQLPSIPLVQYIQITPTSSKYWTGWPTKANPYTSPGLATMAATEVIHHLKKAG